MLWLATQVGASVRKLCTLKDTEREMFGVVEVATLTLLGLIIGFSFSMAISRYDLRKTCEEAEATAIGTAYLRAGLLPAADAAGVRGLLRKYLDLRVAFYQTSNKRALQQINADTAQLQGKDVVCGTSFSRGATDTRSCPRGFEHERRVKFPGKHPGSLVEPHPNGRMGFDDNDRYLLQSVGRL